MLDNDRRLVEPRNVSMYSSDWATVDQYSETMGYGSTSAALRRIVREWAQFKQAQIPLPQTAATIPCQ